MPAPYLLDTTVLLHWTRNSHQAQAIDANFQLSSSAMRPLVCEVSLGEMLAFSLSRSWGTQKLRRLAELERHVVVVHISDPGVRQAYAELSTFVRSRPDGRYFTARMISGSVRRRTPQMRIFSYLREIRTGNEGLVDLTRIELVTS